MRPGSRTEQQFTGTLYSWTIWTGSSMARCWLWGPSSKTDGDIRGLQGPLISRCVILPSGLSWKGGCTWARGPGRWSSWRRGLWRRSTSSTRTQTSSSGAISVSENGPSCMFKTTGVILNFLNRPHWFWTLTLFFGINDIYSVKFFPQFNHQMYVY